MSSQQPQHKAASKAKHSSATEPSPASISLVLSWPPCLSPRPCRGCSCILPQPESSSRLLHCTAGTGRSSDETSQGESCGRDEEPEAEQRGQLGRLRRGREERAQQRRRRGVQAGEEGRGEEPEAAHEGPLPQALLPHPSRRRHARLPPLRRRVGGGVQSRQQAGRGDAAGPAGQRGGVHQAAQGADRGAEAAEGGLQRRRRGHGAGCGGRVRRRRAHADDRGAVPGRDAGRGAHQRGRPALQAARGHHRAGAGGRRGGQRQLLRHRGQDLLHRPLAGALPEDRRRRRQGLPEAARAAACSDDPRLSGLCSHRAKGVVVL